MRKKLHIFYWFCQKPLFAWLTKSYPNSLRILATFSSSSLPTTLPTDWNVNQMRNYTPSTTTSHKSISNYRKKSVHHNFVRFPALGLKCDSFSRNFGLNWRASVLIALHFNFFIRAGLIFGSKFHGKLQSSKNPFDFQAPEYLSGVFQRRFPLKTTTDSIPLLQVDRFVNVAQKAWCWYFSGLDIITLCVFPKSSHLYVQNIFSTFHYNQKQKKPPRLAISWLPTPIVSWTQLTSF